MIEFALEQVDKKFGDTLNYISKHILTFETTEDKNIPLLDNTIGLLDIHVIRKLIIASEGTDTVFYFSKIARGGLGFLEPAPTCQYYVVLESKNKDLFKIWKKVESII